MFSRGWADALMDHFVGNISCRVDIKKMLRVFVWGRREDEG